MALYLERETGLNHESGFANQGNSMSIPKAKAAVCGPNFGRKLDIEIDAKTRASFEAKIKRSKTTGCWIWMASKNHQGYGYFGVRGRIIRAHRVSYLMHVGSIPSGLCVLHNCPTGDNPSCVNPKHLFLGTHQQNLIDMVSKGRRLYHGEHNKNAHLSVKEVCVIRELYETDNYTQTELATKYGVTQTTISRLVNFKNWKKLA